MNCQTVLMQMVGQRVITNIQQQFYTHVLYADLATLSDETSGKLVSRFTNDIYMLRQSVASVMTGLAKETLTLIFLVSLMFDSASILRLMARSFWFCCLKIGLIQP